VFRLPGVHSAADVPGIRLRYVVQSLDSKTWHDSPGIAIKTFGMLRPGGKEGVFKEVLFPLESAADAATVFRINLPGIRVNGVGLDPDESRDRSGNLYELLGFELSGDSRK